MSGPLSKPNGTTKLTDCVKVFICCVWSIQFYRNKMCICAWFRFIPLRQFQKHFLMHSQNIPVSVFTFVYSAYASSTFTWRPQQHNKCCHFGAIVNRNRKNNSTSVKVALFYFLRMLTTGHKNNLAYNKGFQVRTSFVIISWKTCNRLS